MNKEEIFKKVLDSAFKVHTALGPGLLEKAYEECLFYELISCGIFAEKQKAMPINYAGFEIETGYRIDLFVERQIIVEIKSVNALSDVHFAQILTYMKLAESSLGLLVNFNVNHLKQGIRRVVL